jgi:colanic acid/amylovoran biosynthesis glycosyltransferase
MRQVAIFRHNLFKLSEPFIAQQAEALQRYRPVYLGRLRFGAAPAGADSLAIADLARRPWLAAGAQIVAASPTPYLRLLDDRHPALIHAHFGVEGVYALPLAERLGIPLVTSFHGFDATLSTAGLLANPGWVRYALGRRRLARRGQLFLCASAFLRTKVLTLGFPPERTRVHYLGVDLATIMPRHPDEEQSVILHVARLEPVKGSVTLLRAFALVAGSHPESRLVIIGDGQLRGALEQEARSTGVRDRIDFIGARPHREVLGWMRRAAVLVIPSIRTEFGREEGLGMVMLEAAAHGVPVIGSRVGGIPEGIDDGQTGFLVPERDPTALAQRLRMLLADAALRRGLGTAGRTKMEAQFDLAQQIATLETLYDGLLGEPV